jgi:hypothetical protein
MKVDAVLQLHFHSFDEGRFRFETRGVFLDSFLALSHKNGIGGETRSSPYAAASDAKFASG